MNTLRPILIAVLVASVSDALLRRQPTGDQGTEAELKAQIASEEEELKQLQPESDATKEDAASNIAISKPKTAPSPPRTEEEKLQALNSGLKLIHGLRSTFKKDDGSHAGAEKFANGAMSEELSNKDSQVWSAIESMLGAVEQTTSSMKGKSKAEREKAMTDLEGRLNQKAGVLNHVTTDVEKKQRQQDEEYLLGLLIMHQKDWPMQQQLNATQTFMHDSPVLHELFEHHDASKPLAPQLAVLMDAAQTKQKTKDASARSAGAQAILATNAKKQKAAVGRSASVAAHLFIQLTATFTGRA